MDKITTITSVDDLTELRIILLSHKDQSIHIMDYFTFVEMMTGLDDEWCDVFTDDRYDIFIGYELDMFDFLKLNLETNDFLVKLGADCGKKKERSSSKRTGKSKKD